MNKDLIHSSILYRKEMALKMGIYILICTSALIVSLVILKSRQLELALIMLLVLPVFFIKWFVKFFRREVVIKLDFNTVSILSINERNNSEEQFIYKLEELSSFSFELPNRRFSCIKLNQKSGRSKEYSFINEADRTENINPISLLELFYSTIEDYNEHAPEFNRIIFKPSFFASNSGLICIAVLSILFLTAIAVNLYLQTKTAPITLFFVLAILVQLLIKRNSDKRFYSKMIASRIDSINKKAH